jgi:hypothetical protein
MADAALDWNQRPCAGWQERPFLFCKGAIMRTLHVAFATSLLLLSAHGGAQTQNYPTTTSTAMSSVQVTAPARFARVYQEHLDAVQGRYALSNGWHLKVDSAKNGIKAQIDSERPIHLVAVTRDRFVSNDGRVDMVFNQGDYGDDMVMSYVPGDNPLAQRIVVRTTVAQR